MGKQNYCQSCAMPMGETGEFYGTNADGSKNNEYCKYCYENGKFKGDCTMEEMIEICIPHMVEQGMSETEARRIMNDCMPNLKRWKKA